MMTEGGADLWVQQNLSRRHCIANVPLAEQPLVGTLHTWEGPWLKAILTQFT